MSGLREAAEVCVEDPSVVYLLQDKNNVVAKQRVALQPRAIRDVVREL